MIALLRTKDTVESRLAGMSAMTHGNYLKKTEEYFEFIHSNFSANREGLDQLAEVANKCADKKIAFLAVATACLLYGKAGEQLVEQHEKRFGSEYLIAMELSLAIFLKGLNSPRGGPLQDKIAGIKVHLVANLRAVLDFLKKKNQLNGTLSNFVDRFLPIGRDESLTKSLTIAIVLDDLNPLRTATLTKMVFDLAAVLLEYTNHNIVIICSRLHAPNNQFWMPGVHQTRLVPLKEYMEHYDIGLEQFGSRLSMVNLNEVFYGTTTLAPIEIDVVLTYPFRHGILEPVLYARAPVVEIEIMSGISSATNCDVIIPNGVPSESFLKANFAKTALVQLPRRRFKGGANTGFAYLKDAKKFIVSASKDFDKRAELDIGEYLEHVVAFLEKSKDFSWVFVGGSRDFETMLAERYPELIETGKLVAVNYEQDLPGLLSLAYLYAQPPIIGGGRSPSIAIENGCPVVTFQFGDCTRYVPFKCQFKDLEDMFKAIPQITDSEKAREELLAICAAVVVPTVNIEAAVSHEAALRRARIKFSGRMR